MKMVKAFFGLGLWLILAILLFFSTWVGVGLGALGGEQMPKMVITAAAVVGGARLMPLRSLYVTANTLQEIASTSPGGNDILATFFHLGSCYYVQAAILLLIFSRKFQ